jgi:hypothetical protein
MTAWSDPRQLGAPPSPPDLIVRVSEERARGMRMVLPDGEPATPRPRLRIGVLAATAAVLVIGLVAVSRWSTPQEPAAEAAARGACDMNTETRALLMTGSFLLATACAQEPSAPYEPAPPVRALGANELQEGAWVYRVGRQGGRITYEPVHTLERVGTGPDAEWRSVDVRHNPIARGPGWQGQLRADTVYYAADGLTPLRHAHHDIRGGRERWTLTATFGPDSVHSVSDYLGYGGVPRQRRETSAATQRDGAPMVLAVHDPALGMLLRRLPLEAGWSGSFRVGPFGDGWFREESLRVDGEETVEVPAGVFDCWRLTMTPPFPPYDYRIWVTKDGQLLVKTLLGPEGRALERVLVSASPESR